MNKAPSFIVDTLKASWKPGQKVLEIGCGPAFLRSEFGEHYIGTDITNKPYNSDLKRNVDIVCSGEKLPIKKHSVDLVIIKSALYLFSDWKAALYEVKRVLVPGGQLFVFDYNRRTQKDLQRREQHDRYPCWSQWRLKQCLRKVGFKKATLLLPQSLQFKGYLRQFHLLMEELYGTWAIVRAEGE